MGNAVIINSQKWCGIPQHEALLPLSAGAPLLMKIA